MAILLRNIKLYEPAHAKHGKQTDILVKDGKIEQIGQELNTDNVDHIINGEDCSVSIGWTDLNCALNDPGFEYKEDISSLCNAAETGGFTDVAVLPNTNPIVDTVQVVKYIKQQSNLHAVALHPIAAFTKKTKGTELSEMIDLHKAGVSMFSDGSANVDINSVFGRALRYLQPFNGILMCYPEDADLLANGQMHEGKESTLLGMKGMPAMAEEVAVMKALKLLEYYGGRLHFSTISTAGSVKLIREAKKKDLRVTCDVAAYQYSFTDEALQNFDTYLKVKPPFRTASDNAALIAGLKDGTIDAIVSNHKPQDTESKQLEFDLADFGVISLETAYAAANTFHNGKLSTELLIEKLGSSPRKLAGLDIQIVKEGLPACLTIFNENLEWVCNKKDFISKAGNSPFIGQKLKGKALGVIQGEKYHFTDLLISQFLEK
jgi:dihydroorotase